MSNPVMVNRKARNGENQSPFLMHMLWCPGCNDLHAPRSRLPETRSDHAGPLWEWDGNLAAPTFSPSYKSWATYGPEHKKEERVCHSYIRNGNWIFLNDCTHALAGQTVPLPSVPDWVVQEAD